MVLAGDTVPQSIRVGWRSVNVIGGDPFDIFSGVTDGPQLEALIAHARTSVSPEELQVLDLRGRPQDVRDEAYYSELARTAF